MRSLKFKIIKFKIIFCHYLVIPPKGGQGVLFSNNLYSSVDAQFDNLAGFALTLVVLARAHDVVNALLDFFGDFVEASRRGLAADVGTGADNGALVAVTELVADVLASHAETDTAVPGNEAGSEVDGTVEDEGEGLLGKLDEVPGNVGHLTQVALHPVRAVHQADHRLAVLAPLQLENPSYSLLVGSIATDAPDGVCGVEDESALP